MNTKNTITFFNPDFESPICIPMVAAHIPAGFPSPAEDFLDTTIDLNQELTKNPLATFFVKVTGNSMIGAGINDSDVLVADRSLEPADGRIAICLIDGEFTVKRIKLDRECLYLMPENEAFQPIKVTESNQFTIWAIVTYVIKRVL